MIRHADNNDTAQIHAVINDAAMAYKGVIPADRWHEPYMPRTELQQEIRQGVKFLCYCEETTLVGVMGTQDKGDVTLIRHAYIRSDRKRRGVGAQLLTQIVTQSSKPILIGTWKAATWAISFYVKHGFRIVPDAESAALLAKYWRVPRRQIEESIVLADARYFDTRDNLAGTA